jgi:hypothetical protein
MGYPGVELAWKAGSDNNWISYYEVFRNGTALDKVSKGTFYFDHSAGADLAAHYEICTVDGAGNASGKTSAQGSAGRPATILDDAPGCGFKYSGEWDHQKNLLLAHAQTLSVSSQKGATAELQLEGKRVMLFTRLSANGGKAKVTIDGGAPEVIDTYSGDEVWGVCAYRKTLTTGSGGHALRIEVLAEHDPRAKGNLVYVDGVRIEQQ